MEQPQEIEDEDYERTWERVAAVDVAKATGVVCTRVPDEDRSGRCLTRIWTVQATVGGVTELGDHLRCQGIEVVTIESTSDYWRIWVRHEAHCCIARLAGVDWRRCFTDLMAYQGPKG
jgi:transposase